MEADGADYVKAFMDGTLGSRTARLLDGTGVEITSSSTLAGIVRAAARRGLPVAVHAIGDRANREALDAFAATRTIWRPLGLRHRIEHAQCVHPDDVPRFAQLGVTASVQFTHATSDRDVADRLWGERAAHAYPYRSLLEAGARLAGGSDAPIEELDPLAGLRAAVLRTDPSARRGGPSRRSAWTPRSRRSPASPRGSRAPRTAAGGSRPASPPTSSCSTATRGTTSPPHGSPARCWPATGCWTRDSRD